MIGRPAAHTLVEALRFSFPFGGVPLASLGISQVAGPLAGVARVGGVILHHVGGVPARLRHRRARRAPGPDRLVVAGGAAAASCRCSPSSRRAARAPGVLLDVAAVQGGGEQGTSCARRAQRRSSPSATSRRPGRSSPTTSLDLVLWPENVIDVEDFATSEELAAVAAEAERLGVPFAVGITEDVPGRPGRVTNAQVVVTPDGDVTSRYDKVRRVPFGEYVPLRGLLEAIGAPVDQVPTNAIAGTEPAVVELPDGTRLGVVISWEVFFGGRAREGVKAGGEALLNPTNGASYTGTIVQTQQVASSRLRAIETGRWVVQAAPTGFSEFVTPDGDVIDRTAVSEQAVIRHEIELRTGRTWYVTLGDRPWIVALAGVLIAPGSCPSSAGRRAGDRRQRAPTRCRQRSMTR